MHERQTIPIGRADGGSNLLGAILSRLGIVAIVVVGVLIAPTGLPDLSKLAGMAGTTASATAMPEPEPVPWPTPRRALEQTPPSKATPAAWIPTEPVGSPGNDGREATPPIDELGAYTMHQSASRPTDDRGTRTMFQRVCLKLKDGLQRLGGFVLARGFSDAPGQRIPASFIPSRS